MLDPLDQLDVSLQDFEPPPPARYAPPPHPRPPSRPDETDASDPDPDHPDSASVGGYSPPAWRRLENGRKSSGFWRAPDNLLRPSFGLPQSRGGPLPKSRGVGPPPAHTRESSPEAPESDDEDDVAVLARAMRTRLPTGSLSPEKGNSPDPERTGTETTIKIDDVMAASKTPVAENCKFASVLTLSLAYRPRVPFVHSFHSHTPAKKTSASPCAPRSNKGRSPSTPP